MISSAVSRPKSVVCLSAGLDSTVNLYMALQTSDVVMTLTFDYGQKAATQEIASSKAFAEKLNLPHQVIHLPWLKNFGESALTSDTESIPTAGAVALDNLSISKKTAKSVWVPNRNGIFLNIAAGLAEGLKADYVIPGFNLEEATTFPDNSEDFMNSLDQAFSFSTAHQVKVKCFTVKMNKSEIVQAGLKLNVPFEMIWPCYFAGDRWCGECESCQRAQRAFRLHNVPAIKLFLK